MPVQKDPEETETLHLHRLADIASRHVLEVGCGDGRLTWRYAHSAAQVTGLDPDADALQTASSNRPVDLRAAVSFAQASSLHLPFPRETFDRAILAWSL
jgi:ubiquinone/menaquinone biosynthesis C-methylase UbiE